MRYVTSAEVCRLAGCTYRELDQWTRRGYVSPSACEGPPMSEGETPREPGSGHARLWTADDVRTVRMMTRAVRAGFAHAAAAAVALGRRDLAAGITVSIEHEPAR